MTSRRRTAAAPRRLSLLLAPVALSCGSLLLPVVVPGHVLAQAPAAASRVLGTLVSRTDSSLTIKPDTGDAVTVALLPETSVLRLPPGSTDLKTAEPATLSDLEPSDRVLVLLSSGAASPTARRVLVMKGGAIAAQHQSAQEGWAHSRGGVVELVDGAAGTVTLRSGGRPLTVTTTPNTVIRRYAAGSVRFEDARRTDLNAVKPGDQLRVRGSGTPPAPLVADEIVFGAFTQIAGVVTSFDPATSQLVLRDTKTKAPVTVKVGDHTELRHLTPELAKTLAARSEASGHGAAHGSTAASPAGAAAPPADPAEAIAALPTLPASSLKAGEPILLVATSGAGEGTTAVSILTGAAPVLAAMESGGGSTSLSAWSLGGAEASE